MPAKPGNQTRRAPCPPTQIRAPPNPISALQTPSRAPQTWEPDHEPAVQGLGGVGVSDVPQGHNPGRGDFGGPGEALQSPPAARAAGSDHGHPAAPRRGGQREDGVTCPRRCHRRAQGARPPAGGVGGVLRGTPEWAQSGGRSPCCFPRCVLCSGVPLPRYSIPSYSVSPRPHILPAPPFPYPPIPQPPPWVSPCPSCPSCPRVPRVPVTCPAPPSRPRAAPSLPSTWPRPPPPAIGQSPEGARPWFKSRF